MCKCNECQHLKVCKLFDEYDDLQKDIQQLKYNKEDFKVEVKCKHFYSNMKVKEPLTPIQP